MPTEIIAVFNGKGGAGKSPTAVALAYAYARAGRKVLLVDADSQATASFHTLGKKYKYVDQTLYDGVQDRKLETYVVPIPVRVSRFPGSPDYEKYLYLLPANDTLQKGEDDLLAGGGTFLWQNQLKKFLKKYYEKDFDIIIIDTPGSHISVYILMALTAATKALVPIKTEISSVEGTVDTMMLLKNVREGLNPNLNMWGILPTQYESNNQHHRDALTLMHTYFKDELAGEEIYYSVYKSPSLKRNHYNKALAYRCDVREVPTSEANDAIASGPRDLGAYWDDIALDLLFKEKAPVDPDRLANTTTEDVPVE